MATLYEVLADAQHGEALDQISQQFGLSPQQTQAAVSALLPAMSMGLKRSTTTPEGLGELFGLMGQQPDLYAMYDDPNAAFSSEGRSAGNVVLSNMFGSPDASRAIAAQAQQLSGVTSGILKKLLPVLAGILISGLMRGKPGKAEPTPVPQSQADAGGGVLADILRQIFGQAGTGPSASGQSGIPPLKDILGKEREDAPAPTPRQVPESQPSPTPGTETGNQPSPAPLDPGSDLMATILRELEKAIREGRLKPVVIGPVEIPIPGQTGPAQSSPGQNQPAPGGADIFGQILREILGGAGGKTPQGAGAAVFGDLLEPGATVAPNQRDAFQQVLDRFLGGTSP